MAKVAKQMLTPHVHVCESFYVCDVAPYSCFATLRPGLRRMPLWGSEACEARPTPGFATMFLLRSKSRRSKNFASQTLGGHRSAPLLRKPTVANLGKPGRTWANLGEATKKRAQHLLSERRHGRKSGRRRCVANFVLFFDTDNIFIFLTTNGFVILYS
jgi:hypothetical protein